MAISRQLEIAVEIGYFTDFRLKIASKKKSLPCLSWRGLIQAKPPFKTLLLMLRQT